ncbi:LacI family DNA-binding transcriptional regulator [Streptomyces sp. NPDC002588]|uniref:LacI family DNA-binding transcriptional regulator n=1 Tax=Streptomyces sp. NPDC002588 TaxID=3154419 RepID=UPI00331A08DF
MGGDAEYYREQFAGILAARGGRRRRPGVKDVAAIADVGVGTASDALNGKGRMNPATRDRIRQVADAIGYYPSALARSLQSNKSGIIGLSIRPFGGAPLQYLEVSYYARFLNAATVAALEHGYALVVLPPSVPTLLRNIPIDGVIVTDPPPGDPLVTELKARGLAHVTDLGEADDPKALCVGNDQAKAVIGVCDHFKRQGATTVGLLVADADEDYTVRSLAGFRQWAEANGQIPRIERTSITDPVSMMAAARRLLAAPGRPDAVYTTEAPAGSYLVKAVGEQNLRMPEDVLVAYCAEHAPDAGLSEVTRLSLNAERVAEEAVDLLTSVLSGSDPTPRHRIVDTELHVHASSLRNRNAEPRKAR